MANPVMPARLGNIIAVPNMRKPEQSSQAFPLAVDFTKGTIFDGSLQAAFETGDFDFAQSVFIDNSQNSSALTLVFPGAGPVGQTIVAAAGTQGYYPVSPAMNDPRFTVSTNGGVVVPITFFNVPMPYFVWGGGASGGAAIGSFTDRRGVVAVGGASQVLAAANSNRRQILIENPLTAAGQGGIAAAESLYINFTGASGVDNGSSIELVPGGSYVSGSPVSTQQVTVTAATAGHVFIAKEM